MKVDDDQSDFSRPATVEALTGDWLTRAL